MKQRAGTQDEEMQEMTKCGNNESGWQPSTPPTVDFEVEYMPRKAQVRSQCAEEQQHEDDGQSAIFSDVIELTATRMMMQHAEALQCEDIEQSAILGDAIEPLAPSRL
mmetsp:Transcript_88906/g.154212  ORF Transcript_88906/g.154212 Transcript_88906/m.154212 type:complete len:108 (-) Transcript_88906:228-551(-)